MDRVTIDVGDENEARELSRKLRAGNQLILMADKVVWNLLEGRVEEAQELARDYDSYRTEHCKQDG